MPATAAARPTDESTPSTKYHVVRDPGEVREVFRRVEEFMPTNALTTVVPLSATALRVLSRARFALPPVLASATGDRHRAVRKMVAAFFTPAKVEAVGPRVTTLTRQRCQAAAKALESGPIDLADIIGRRIPPVIMQELTGFACPDLMLLKRWSRDSLELFWGWPDEERQVVLAISAAEFYGWLRETVIASKGDDSLFGVLHAAGLSTPEICSLGYFLVIAGQETTAQLINIAFYRALQNRTLWHELSQGASAAAFVRGVLASESSVHTWRRVSAMDSLLGGVNLPAGAEILLELSGQHPAGAVPTAYSLAFGHGLHRCLGAKLAELETITVLEETARAFPTLVFTGPEPKWIRLLSFQTPTTVMATLEPA
ncbi:MAG: cytochrome P450 [Microbacteriaceae bacterium]|nr:cytochrome P450 [Microbacteriaceae bacterium]